MTESDYINATNYARLALAGDALRGVLSGDEYGVPRDAYMKVNYMLIMLRDSAAQLCAEAREIDDNDQ